MFTLIEPLADSLEYKEQKLWLDLAYDTVLLWFELLASEELSEEEKITLGFNNFVDSSCDFSLEEQAGILEKIMAYVLYTPYGQKENEYLVNEEKQPQLKKEMRYFSFTKDAGAIFSSFYSEYGIDLVEQRGKLHYLKFSALLAGLSPNSYFKRIIKIRQTDPTKFEGEELADILESQNYFALDEHIQSINLTTQMANTFDLLLANVKGGER